jgi:hypothetical protein
MKRTNKLKIFEAYVLRSLSIQAMLIGIIYLLYKEWLFGIIIIIVSFLYGSIGQGLKHNKIKSSGELLTGQDWNIIENGEDIDMTTEEGHLIGKPILFTIIVSSLIAILIFFFQNYKWYSALPLGLIIGISYPLLLLFISIIITNKIYLKK